MDLRCVVGIDDALTRLAALDERLARVVECRFFGGMTGVETATVPGVAERTVRRDWIKARTWAVESATRHRLRLVPEAH